MSVTQEQEFQQYLTELEIRNYQQRFSNVSQFCFDQCVHKFKKKDIVPEERQCVESCVDKYANAWDRCIKRFQEYMMMQQQMQQGMR